MGRTEENVIKLTVWFFEIDGYGGMYCKHDYLDIYGSSTPNPSQKIGTYCGGDIPDHITSTEPDLFVRFISSKYVSARGFNMSFEVIDVPGIDVPGSVEINLFPNSLAFNVPGIDVPGNVEINVFPNSLAFNVPGIDVPGNVEINLFPNSLAFNVPCNVEVMSRYFNVPSIDVPGNVEIHLFPNSLAFNVPCNVEVMSRYFNVPSIDVPGNVEINLFPNSLSFNVPCNVEVMSRYFNVPSIDVPGNVEINLFPNSLAFNVPCNVEVISRYFNVPSIDVPGNVEINLFPNSLAFNVPCNVEVMSRYFNVPGIDVPGNVEINLFPNSLAFNVPCNVELIEVNKSSLVFPFSSRKKEDVPPFCGYGHLKCRNNNCVPSNKTCNGHDDCGDGTDEENCPGFQISMPKICGTPVIKPKVMTMRQDQQRNVVGGNAAVPGSWPWIVQLKLISFGGLERQLVCAGTLINELYVMTAAHCFKDRLIPFKFDNFNQPKITWGMKKRNDIALLRLNAPVEMTKIIQPACLPPSMYNATDGNLAYVLGWGNTQSKYLPPYSSKVCTIWFQQLNDLFCNTKDTGYDLRLKQGPVPIYDHSQCENSYPGRVWNSSICAGLHRGGVDSCTGDSGGPLMQLINKKWTVIGIVSFGAPECAQPDEPGVYTNVGSYINWIHQVVFNKTNLIY
ncbi:Plasminogen [Nymphon striatum]|nr:Plasminogen [Nymphon striatum]